MYGHEGVVKILLGREDVTPDKPDNRGQTPFMCTAKRGHQEVVTLLQPYNETITPSALLEA